MTLHDLIDRSQYPLSAQVIDALIERELAATEQRAIDALMMTEPLYAKFIGNDQATEATFHTLTMGPGGLRIREVLECLLRYQELRALQAALKSPERQVLGAD